MIIDFLLEYSAQLGSLAAGLFTLFVYISNRRYQKKADKRNIEFEARQLRSDVDALISSANVLMGIDPQTETFHSFATRANLNQAKELLSKALTLMPDYANVHYGYGLYYMGIKNPKSAEQAFRNAIRTNPNLAAAHNNLYLIAPPQNQNEAEAHLRNAVRLAPNSPIYLVNLGVLELQKQNYEEAGHIFQKAIEADPGYPNSYVGLGQICLQNENLSEAEKLATKAIEIYPDLAIAYKLLAEVYIIRGLFNEARSKIEKAIELDPNYKDYQNLLKDIQDRMVDIRD